MRPRPDEYDINVGLRLREARRLAGLTQVTLAEAVGISFQQIQKYETGTNRIGAGRLHSLSRILNVNPSFFFEDRIQDQFGPEDDDAEGAPESLNATRRLPHSAAISGYYAMIGDKTVRRQVFQLVKAIALAHAEAAGIPAIPDYESPQA